MNKKNEPKTIGKLTKARGSFGMDANTRIIENKKGKGSYNRNKMKNVK